MNINKTEYRDKVLGCWMGKNIGGTFGAPYEGEQYMNNADFYTNIIPGEPIPNDDLDIQLVWLLAAEERSIFRLTPRILGEYWMKYVIGPWNEYGVCRANIGNGFTPPLSGSVNNEKWKWSNGAWIRSEIWACIAPGSPDEAVRLAYMDACCDHYGEGVFAEMFIAALESAAFAVTDTRELIKIGLAKIPADCRISRVVKLVCELYDKKTSFKEAREAALEDSKDLGWFQAPLNIGFVVIGLLYGEGDFDKSLKYAVNCGDDTDCTGATVGSILGIQYGAAKIPQRWIEPIGMGLRTIAVNNVDLCLPKDLHELSDRVIQVAIEAYRDNPLNLIPITNAPAEFPDTTSLSSSDYVSKRIWKQSPYELTFDLPWGEVSVEYEKGPDVEPGKSVSIWIRVAATMTLSNGAAFKLNLPTGWTAAPGHAFAMLLKSRKRSSIRLEITPGEFTAGAIQYIQLEVKLQDRNAPNIVMVPFQLKGAVYFEDMIRHVNFNGEPADYYGWIDNRRRLIARREFVSS